MTAVTKQCDILVVEDDDAIRFILAETLSDEGHHVATANHGKAALDYLQQAESPPRLILLDLMMPVMDGIAFRAVQKLHPTWRDIPVVVLSAIAGVLDLRQKIDLDAVAYLEKPIEWSRIEQVIDQWCPN